MRDLKGVEIFRAGVWNGDVYTEADLDRIVEASRAELFTPPVKLGHEDTPGGRSYGWVENLERVGPSLFADLVALPDAVYRALANREYGAVSCEMLWDVERNGIRYPRVLRAVSLLGCEIPAVNLVPLKEHPDLVAASFTVAPPTRGAPPPVEPRTIVRQRRSPPAPLTRREGDRLLAQYALEELRGGGAVSMAHAYRLARTALPEAARAYHEGTL
jgi:hypothetical protein